MKAIEFKDVSYKYNGAEKNAVNSVSFDIEEGEFVAVLGRNGSGKSTLAKMINCLILPSSGEVTVMGMDTKDKQNQFEIRKNAGMVFQNPDNQMIATIVEDDIAFGPENIGIPRAEIGERIDFALEAVGMSRFRRATPARLSGGQKQRIAIAGVLAIKPKILILDESTAMLDPRGRKEVMDVIRRLNKEQGMTIVHITHYMDEACCADRIVVMNRGEAAMQGAPLELFKRQEEIESFGLDLPKPVRYASALKEKGVDLGGDILFKEELAERLCGLLRKN